MGFATKTGTPVPLSEAQVQIWNVFKVLKDYLDKRSVKFYLLGGSLLGAVRHRGFIPWDDDIDIGIERSEYEKFLKDIADNLPSHLQLRHYGDNTDHHYYFSRIVDTRFFMERSGSLVTRKENVWVDIFPLDGMPNNYFARKIHMMRLLWVRAMYHIACFEKVNLKRPHRPLSERVVIKFIQLTGFKGCKPFKFWLEKLDVLLKKYSIENSNWVVNFMGQYKFKEMFPKSYYGEGKMYEFEGEQLPGPEHADKVLKQMYGDYMKEPADADKNVHDARLIKDEK